MQEINLYFPHDKLLHDESRENRPKDWGGHDHNKLPTPSLSYVPDSVSHTAVRGNLRHLSINKLWPYLTMTVLLPLLKQVPVFEALRLQNATPLVSWVTHQLPEPSETVTPRVSALLM